MGIRKKLCRENKMVIKINDIVKYEHDVIIYGKVTDVDREFFRVCWCNYNYSLTYNYNYYKISKVKSPQELHLAKLILAGNL